MRSILRCLSFLAAWVVFIVWYPLLVAAATSQPAPLSASVVYRNRPRSDKWLDRQYALHREHLVYVDGPCINIQVRPRRGDRVFDRTVPGRLRRYAYDGRDDLVDVKDLHCQVAQLLGNGSILAYPWHKTSRVSPDGSVVNGPPALGRTLMHITGVDDANLIDGSTLRAHGTTDGKYSYSDTRGARRTVSSYRAVKHPNRKQFKAALLNGMKLVWWEKKTIKCPECHGRSPRAHRRHDIGLASGWYQPPPCKTCHGRKTITAWYKRCVP